jgi:SAM-dependent MidA family methyltransferase
MEKIAGAIERGYLFTIDYGYTKRERIRFPQGTLMSYRRHMASEDVLTDPGERDITAHVLFTALEDYGQRHGFVTEKFGTLAQALLAAGESDAFAGVLGEGAPAEQERRRLQLKQLLFGLGESFRTLLLRKGSHK